MKLSPGGVISFREVVRHFSAADNGPPAIKDKTPIGKTTKIKVLLQYAPLSGIVFHSINISVQE